MVKLESTFKNMVLVLCGVSIFAAGSLGLVNDLTSEPIRLAELVKQEAAIREVTPGFNNAPVEEQYKLITPEGDSLICFPAKQNGKLTGVAIESYSKKGFGGEIKMMVGLDPEGRIYNYSVLSHSETPGLGSKMAEWFKADKNKQSIIGLDPGKNKVWVVKDGGDVDAITAATISSRAFLDAIDRAYRSYMASLNISLDARTGASAQKNEGKQVQTQELVRVQEIAQVNPEPKHEKRLQTKSKPKQKIIGEKAEVGTKEKVDAQSAASQDYSKNEGEEKVNEKQ